MTAINVTQFLQGQKPDLSFEQVETDQISTIVKEGIEEWVKDAAFDNFEERINALASAEGMQALDRGEALTDQIRAAFFDAEFLLKDEKNCPYLERVFSVIYQRMIGSAEMFFTMFGWGDLLIASATKAEESSKAYLLFGIA